MFKAWGITFDDSKVVADLEHTAQMQDGPNPAVLALNETAVNRDDVVTADADSLYMAFTGAFIGTPADGLTRTVLIQSSKRAGLVDPMTAAYAGGRIASELNVTGTEYPLAIRLSGKFKTAFPEGKPKPANPGEQNPPEKNSTDNSLKESTQPTTVVLVGDSDMIQDQLSVRELAGLGERLIVPLNSNLSFAQGVVEQLAGDSNLIGVRSRALRARPFTVVQKLQAEAEANYRNKIKELETSLAQTQQRVNELATGQGRKPALHSFARTTTGAGELPPERGRREDAIETDAAATARRDRFAREPIQMDQHRDDAGAGRGGGICARDHET